ncbi:MAG TPA: glycosyltransferase family 87 protein [Solirubrobacterales bacterium]|nr:glycosyltransferase family 87 protein [Solirubrobacterales bacterium]
MSWGSLLRSRKVWIWAAVWLLTRFLIVAHVGFWNDAIGPQWEDVSIFGVWSEGLGVHHALPNEEAWQYPPGAALLLVLPRIGWAAFGYDFVATMLIVDLIGLVLVARLGQREGSDAGVWVWLLAMPMLRALPVLRFDLVPTVLAIGGLLVIHRRPAWFGALAGLGAMIKAWPIALLFGEWDRGRLLRAGAGAAAAIVLVFAISAIAFSGDQLNFLKEQNGRGLQVESVASLPWHLRQYVTGQEIDAGIRYRAWEIEDHGANVVAEALKWLSLAALIAAGVWWLARSRAIRRGREELEDAVVSRDFIFVVVLLLVVTSRVLSPQYMIWMLGLAAVVLTASRSRLKRPAWIVVAAAILTTSAYGPMGAYGTTYNVYGPAFIMLIRNLALIVAAVDASLTMVRLLREDSPRVAVSTI